MRLIIIIASISVLLSCENENKTDHVVSTVYLGDVEINYEKRSKTKSFASKMIFFTCDTSASLIFTEFDTTNTILNKVAFISDLGIRKDLNLPYISCNHYRIYEAFIPLRDSLEAYDFKDGIQKEIAKGELFIQKKKGNKEISNIRLICQEQFPIYILPYPMVN